MPDQESIMPRSVRNYERRLHRHRKLYWRATIPIVLVLGVSLWLGYFLEGLLLAGLGVLVVLLVMLREIIDVLGYLGSLQRNAAVDRAALRTDVAEIKRHSRSEPD